MQLSEVVFMDFEASALRHGYPVEVGWAWVEGYEVLAQGILIKPSEEWLTPEFTWDPIAEDIHGLSMTRLQQEGVSPIQVCRALNEQLLDKVVVFDTGPDGADRYWLDLLFSEAKAQRRFKLGGPAGEVLAALAAKCGINEAVQSAIRIMAPPMTHEAAQDATYYAWRAAAIQLLAGDAGVGRIEDLLTSINVVGGSSRS